MLSEAQKEVLNERFEAEDIFLEACICPGFGALHSTALQVSNSGRATFTSNDYDSEAMRSVTSECEFKFNHEEMEALRTDLIELANAGQPEQCMMDDIRAWMLIFKINDEIIKIDVWGGNTQQKYAGLEKFNEVWDTVHERVQNAFGAVVHLTKTCS